MEEGANGRKKRVGGNGVEHRKKNGWNEGGKDFGK